MKLSKTSLIKRFDWISFATIFILAIFGLLIIYSVALGTSDPQDLLNFKKQFLFIIVGMVMYLLVSFFLDYRILKNLSLVFYVLSLFLLVLVLFFGQTIRGTTGWFSLGGFSFQPVEFAKVALILFLAQYLTQKAKYIYQLRYLISSAFGVILLVVLVMLQPDFGSAIILFSVWFGLILLTGIKKSHLLVMLGGFVIAILVLWFFVFQDYQRQRIMVFLDPSLDPLGSGYNVNQAMIAIGSGKFFGRGLGFGSQSQLKFLPEAQTDFIFAVIGEELGLFGTLILLSLFSILFWRLISIVKQIQDNFGIYLILGTTIVIFVQFFINMGMNVGLLPVTGITLPLVSYGGSSFLILIFLLALAQSVNLHRVSGSP